MNSKIVRDFVNLSIFEIYETNKIKKFEFKIYEINKIKF